jgi:copper transport protein
VGGVAPLGLIIQALGRWLHFAAIALGFGAPFTALAVGAPASARIARLALAGAGLLIGGEVAWLVGQAASLGVSDQASLADIVASPAGRVMGLQLGAAIALWTFLGIGGRPRERSLAIAALGLAVCIVDGAAGHIVKGAPQPLGIALNAIHEGGMAVWVGAFLAVFPGRLSPVRVARIAVPSAAVAVLSGAILALVHIPTPAALLASPYGWTVVLKVAAVAATLAVAAFALRTRRPPRAELIALAVVLLIAGTLVSLPPPR